MQRELQAAQSIIAKQSKFLLRNCINETLQMCSAEISRRVSELVRADLDFNEMLRAQSFFDKCELDLTKGTGVEGCSLSIEWTLFSTQRFDDRRYISRDNAISQSQVLPLPQRSNF